jgi:hypothetical protein
MGRGDQEKGTYYVNGPKQFFFVQLPNVIVVNEDERAPDGSPKAGIIFTNILRPAFWYKRVLLSFLALI